MDIIIHTDNKDIKFYLVNNAQTYDFFKKAILNKNYVFDPMLIKLKNQLIKEKGAEVISEFSERVSSKGLEGLIYRVEKGKRYKLSEDMISILYYVDKNLFRIQNYNYISYSFDYTKIITDIANK